MPACLLDTTCVVGAVVVVGGSKSALCCLLKILSHAASTKTEEKCPKRIFNNIVI